MADKLDEIDLESTDQVLRDPEVADIMVPNSRQFLTLRRVGALPNSNIELMISQRGSSNSVTEAVH